MEFVFGTIFEIIRPVYYIFSLINFILVLYFKDRSLMKKLD